jgi:hypothetical protein
MRLLRGAWDLGWFSGADDWFMSFAGALRRRQTTQGDGLPYPGVAGTKKAYQNIQATLAARLYFAKVGGALEPPPKACQH